ncbi:MAG: anhydro-N-acetylmuramic acid kinase, partial [Bacilli bacterium]
MLAIGLMSGTSLDGVDAALVETEGFKLIKFITLNYDDEFKQKIARNLNDRTATLREISTLNFELSNWFVKAIDKLLDETEYTYNDIGFVSSHGQTVWHDPQGIVPSTLQLGDASVIAYKTKIPVVNNFRPMDIAAGGEGAPLVPFSEYYLYSSKTKNIVMQNIGGISNLTYLKAGGTIDDILSFDEGVGNIMIDYFTKKYFNMPYDEGGKIALSGKINNGLLQYLKEDEFVLKMPPKSTGRERYNYSFMEEIAKKFNFDSLDKKDIVTTITEFTVYGIDYNYKKYLKNIDVIVINGGGSHNTYIMKRLQ